TRSAPSSRTNWRAMCACSSLTILRARSPVSRATIRAVTVPQKTSRNSPARSPDMAPRKKRKGLLSRVIVTIGVLALGFGIVKFGYRYLDRGSHGLAGDKPPPAPTVPHESDTPRRVEGTLSVSTPARDGQLGVSANAAVLFRHVEMYQWQEHCDGACRYD